MAELMSPTDRRRALSYVEAADPALAVQLEAELAMDPTVRVLVQGLDGLRIQSASDSAATRSEVLAELRASRWQMIAVVVLAMVIQAGMIGMAVSIQGAGGSLSVTPSSLLMTPPPLMESPTDGDAWDDAAMVGDSDALPNIGPPSPPPDTGPWIDSPAAPRPTL